MIMDLFKGDMNLQTLNDGGFLNTKQNGGKKQKNWKLRFQGNEQTYFVPQQIVTFHFLSLKKTLEKAFFSLAAHRSRVKNRGPGPNHFPCERLVHPWTNPFEKIRQDVWHQK